MYKDDYIPPYSKQFAHRVNKIKEIREQQLLALKNDVVKSRESGSLLTMSADESKLFHGNRTFGLVRPLSVGRNRINSQPNDTSCNSSRATTPSSRSRRSQSAERYRGRSDSTSTVNVSTSLDKNAVEFRKALQLNRDIAAERKLRESLLQVKKEAYVRYLRDKIDQKKPSWIPSGEGAKHVESMHKSINRVGLEKGLVQKAWRRSPWPGLITAATALNDDDKNSNLPLDSGSMDSAVHSAAIQENRSPGKRNDLHIEVSDADSSVYSFDGTSEHKMSAPNNNPVSPSSSSRLRVSATKFVAAPNTGPPGSPMSAIRSHMNQLRSLPPAINVQSERNVMNSSTYSLASGASSSPLRKRRGSGSSLNGATMPAPHVALTVRLINASKTLASSTKQSPGAAGAGNSYGILTVRSSCSRAEFIGAIERQFGVHDQISDISIASKYGYSGVLTFTSLSLGTIGDQVELNDSTEVNVYLGGTLYQEGDNNRFLHFLEDELTHYEGKYSSCHTPSVGAVTAAVSSRGNNVSGDSATRRGTSQRSISNGVDRMQQQPQRKSSDVPLNTMSSLTAGTVSRDQNRPTPAVRVNLRGNVSVPSHSVSLHQLELQQHVESFSLHSPKHKTQSPHPFSKPTVQLPVPYQVTHSYDGEESNGDERYNIDDILRREGGGYNSNMYTCEQQQLQQQGEEDDTVESYLRSNNYYDIEEIGTDYRPTYTATEYREDEEEVRQYMSSGRDDQQEQHLLRYMNQVLPTTSAFVPTVTAAVKQQQQQQSDFTIADLMPSAQRNRPITTNQTQQQGGLTYTSAQKSFLSPIAPQYSPDSADYSTMRYMTESSVLETPQPRAALSYYHHPVGELLLTPTAADNTTSSSATRRTTATSRAEAIHEKIQHRVATPTYKKPSTATGVSDYSFKNIEENEEGIYNNNKQKKEDNNHSKISTVQEDEEDDTYLLSSALNARKQNTSTVIDTKVAQFAYAAMVSPTLLTSSYHNSGGVDAYSHVNNRINDEQQRDSHDTAAAAAAGAEESVFCGEEETKSHTASQQGSPAPSDLILNSYVQSILSESSASSEQHKQEVMSRDNAAAAVIHNRKHYEGQHNNGELREAAVSVGGSSNNRPPLADLFKSALHSNDINTTISTTAMPTATAITSSVTGMLHIDTSVSIESDDEEEVQKSVHSDTSSSVYGSIVMSRADVTPTKHQHVLSPSAGPESTSHSVYDESPIQVATASHFMDDSQVVRHEELSQQTEPPQQQLPSPASSFLSLTDDTTSRSAVVTSFLERVEQRRTAKQQSSHSMSHKHQGDILSIADLMSDNSSGRIDVRSSDVRVSAAAEREHEYNPVNVLSGHDSNYKQSNNNSSNNNNNNSRAANSLKQRPAVRKSVIHETFIDLSELLGELGST